MLVRVDHRAGRIQWRRDVTPAAWIAGRLHLFRHRVDSLVPTGYQTYARLFHPVESHPAGGTERWAEVARRNGRIAHPRMQFSSIRSRPGHTALEDVARQGSPAPGKLPLAERRALVDLLRAATTTPDRCWFAFREMGFLDDQGVAERVDLPNHDPLLLHDGPIEMALVPPPERPAGQMQFTTETGGAEEMAPAGVLAEESPAAWWPEDRAWFVATEFQLESTYLGGIFGLSAPRGRPSMPPAWLAASRAMSMARFELLPLPVSESSRPIGMAFGGSGGSPGSG